jgi:hypothetical protein
VDRGDSSSSSPESPPVLLGQGVCARFIRRVSGPRAAEAISDGHQCGRRAYIFEVLPYAVEMPRMPRDDSRRRGKIAAGGDFSLPGVPSQRPRHQAARPLSTPTGRPYRPRQTLSRYHRQIVRLCNFYVSRSNLEALPLRIACLSAALKNDALRTKSMGAGQSNGWSVP